MKNSLRSSVVAVVALSAIALVSCTPSVEDPQEQAQQQSEANQPISNAMGGATPAESPASSDPVGELIKLEQPLGAPTDIELAGDILAVRQDAKLGIGTIDAVRTNSTTLLDIDSTCGDITATGDTFVLPCPAPIGGGPGGGIIYLIDAKNPNLATMRTASMKFTSAALTSTGELIGGSSQEPNVVVFRGDDSSNTTTIATSRKADEMVASAVPGSRDGVVFIERGKTVIQGVDYQNDRPGGALRMGVGVGSIAAGEDGLFLATDTLGHQFGVYTDDDILMLHQTHPTDPSPWAINWDSKRKLAWVSSNADNTLTAYAINNGVPEEQGIVNTVANVRSMSIDSDGTIYLVSDSGDGLQVISASDATAAVDKPAQP